MIEVHPFGNFVPIDSKYLLLGSFTGRLENEPSYDWFYCTKRNQFWPIIEQVYDLELNSKKRKQELFAKLHIAVVDIIHSCERRDGDNSDSNLINIVYNPELEDVIQGNRIKKIFFTSRFVEKEYKKQFSSLIEEFPRIELLVLPSPSPRFARMSFEEKVERYRYFLPSLG